MENSLLSRLPPELRNRVYELVLRRPEAIEISAVLPKNEPSAEPLRLSDQPALTRTCMAIRAECWGLFININSSVIRSHPRWHDCCVFAGNYDVSMALDSFASSAMPTSTKLLR